MIDLKEVHCLVTGGTGKIGSAIVEAFLERGAKVTSISRSKSNIFNKINNNRLNQVLLDATNEKDLRLLLEDFANQNDPVNTLVNSCSYRPMKKCMQDSIEKWKDSILNNSLALFVPTRSCIDIMIKRKIQGSIITISSIYGMVSPQVSIYEGLDFESEPDYSYNKFASIGFTKYISGFYAKNNITANIITPGGVFNNQNESFLERYEARVPLNRMANPKDIQGLACFLASEEARYITGAVIPVDGGWTNI